MLDPDEMAAYEEWKERKLTSSTDLSVSAFNVEQEGPALAYEAGVDAGVKGAAAKKSAEEVKKASPYRAQGMTGHIPPKKITS